MCEGFSSLTAPTLARFAAVHVGALFFDWSTVDSEGTQLNGHYWCMVFGGGGVAP